MGTSKVNRMNTFSLSDFIEVEPTSFTRRSTYGNFTCLQSQITNQQIDRYFLQFSTQKQRDLYYQCYLQRYREDYLVNTVQFIDKTRREFCGNLYKVQLYVQHIPVRLGDFTDIPYPDNLYILKSCLIGFKLLYDMIGYFEVQQDHICVNQYGQIKVWLNSDLSKNYPQDIKGQFLSQCDMVDKIISLIQKNTSIQQCPIQFSQFVNKKHHRFPKFNQAISILDKYVEQNKTIIPNYCQSIFQLFRENHESSQAPSKNKQKLRSRITQQENKQHSNFRGSIQISDTPVIPMVNIWQNNDQIQSLNNQSKLQETMIIHRNNNRRSIYEDSGAKTRIILEKTSRITNNAFKPNILTEKTYHTIIGPNIFSKMSPVKVSVFPQIIINVPITHQTVKPKVNFTYGNSLEKIPLLLPQNINRRQSLKHSKHTQKDNVNTLRTKSTPKSIKINKQISNIPETLKQNEQYRDSQTENEPKKQNIDKLNDKNIIQYYDTQTGPQKIDPEIAADLLKYM